MLLNKASLALAQLASKESSRYTLQAICVEKDCTVETDGHQLVSVTHPSELKAANYPLTPGLDHENLDGDAKAVLVHRDAALKALKALPNHSTIPVLACAALGKNATLVTNDLENVQSFKGQTEGRFPDWKHVMPTGEVKCQIGLNAKLLKPIIDYIAKYGGDRTATFKLTVYDKETAVRLDARTEDGQDIMAIVMPLRIDMDAYGEPAKDEEKKDEAA